ncbi:hypothetical protein L218DRAFT_1081883 [Marasmius fiardii PR-910]|nr:hypothetical protein L218DRAFT_1081883 [Marasmius fiardii PR-910]
MDGLSQLDRKRILGAISSGAIPEEDAYASVPESSVEMEDGAQKDRAKRPATRNMMLPPHRRPDVEEGNEFEKGDESRRSVVNEMPPQAEPFATSYTGPDSDTPVTKKRRLAYTLPYVEIPVQQKPGYSKPLLMGATRRTQNGDAVQVPANVFPSQPSPGRSGSQPLNSSFDPTLGRFQTFATVTGPWPSSPMLPPYLYNTGMMPMPTTMTPLSNSMRSVEIPYPSAPAGRRAMSGTPTVYAYNRQETHKYGGESSSSFPQSPTGPVQVPSPSAQTALRNRIQQIQIPPKLSLSKFCKSYSLSASLQKKLEGLKIPGPHVLGRITDKTLSSELNGEWKLVVGEIAELRDAEERWLASLATVLAKDAESGGDLK